VRSPDIVVVLDPQLIVRDTARIVAGLKKGGVVVANSSEKGLRRIVELGIDADIYVVDATGIAKKLGLVVAGWPVVNTSILGALSRATNIVSIESVTSAIAKQWGDSRLSKLNIDAALRAYNETKKLLPQRVVEVKN